MPRPYPDTSSWWGDRLGRDTSAKRKKEAEEREEEGLRLEVGERMSPKRRESERIVTDERCSFHW